MFLEIHTDRRRKHAYSYGLFRETFRENGQVRHRTRGRVTGPIPDQLLVVFIDPDEHDDRSRRRFFGSSGADPAVGISHHGDSR